LAHASATRISQLFQRRVEGRFILVASQFAREFLKAFNLVWSGLFSI